MVLLQHWSLMADHPTAGWTAHCAFEEEPSECRSPTLFLFPGHWGIPGAVLGAVPHYMSALYDRQIGVDSD